MRRRWFLTLASAALARARQEQGPVPSSGQQAVSSGPTYAIAGVVVNAAGNTPLGKVLVQIATVSNRNAHRDVVTGPDGKFSFTNLAASKFTLTVTRESGTPQAYMEQGGFSSAIVTGPGQDTTNIVFRFHLPGALSGAITDENNEAIRGATVHLFSHQIDNYGVRRLAQSTNGFTRASGKFRLSHLQPGNYTVGVSARPWYAGPAYARHTASGLIQGTDRPNTKPVDPQFDVAYPFTYYANTSDPASAAPIAISEGNETDIQMSLRAVPAIHVHLVGGEARPGAGLNVQVSTLGPENHPIPMNAAAFVQAGQGELSGIAAGRYQLLINTFEAPVSGQEYAGSRMEARAIQASRNNVIRKTVDLVDGATVDVSAASHLSVRAAVKTATNDRPSNRIGLMLRDGRTGNTIAAMAGTDEALRFPEANLSPGRYELTLSNTPAFRVLSLEAKGAKVQGADLILEDNADVQLSVLIGRRSPVKVEGLALLEDAPAIGALLLLIPKTVSVGYTVYRDQSDSDGSFVFNGVSAGDYVAIAIDNGRDFAFGEPGVLQPYLAAAQTVTVNESAAPPVLKVSVQQRVT